MKRLDPRVFQIAGLSALACYGLFVLRFDVTPARALLILVCALATQWICTRLTHLPVFEPKSALISAISLILLLRTESEWIAVGAAVAAIASKFVIRWKGKHIFNPTNIAIVLAILIGQAWVSPAQWGSFAFFAFLITCLGIVVVNRARRSDVTFAFLAFYCGLVLARAYWLGDPLSIPLHRFQNGALLLFSFFMISDPRTTPDSRIGRILFALMVAAGAVWIQVRFWRSDALLLSLAFFSVFTPLIDWLAEGRRYEWNFGITNPRRVFMKTTKAAAAILFAFLSTTPLQAFCGFYVAKADTKLFNQASQVVIVRDDDKTVMTMANDYRGEPEEFAIVVPVPTFIKRQQIHIGDKKVIDHLDAYSSPRLVEYFDPNPCQMYAFDAAAPMSQNSAGSAREEMRRAKSLGVTIEARYTIGEYDILILSAKESSGLQTWLVENGYKVPRGASSILGSYLRQNMRFFVARVNLKEQKRLGFTYLRPLQIAYESHKFMLPIRLGTLNASGPQELFVYTLTRNGRVETTNYRTVKLPSDMDLPVFVKDDFARFYKDMFTRQVDREDMSVVFLEYAWDMGWCDPCAADPLSAEELRNLGVFWIDRSQNTTAGAQVFITRLHVRYDEEHFPEDLVFHQTGDKTNFQARYVLRHPFTGNADCQAATQYKTELVRRQEQEVQTLARLTGWSVSAIRSRAKLISLPRNQEEKPWYERIWNR